MHNPRATCRGQPQTTTWRSSHPFGDSEEARLKTTRSEVDSQGAQAFNKARLMTTRSEVHSPVHWRLIRQETRVRGLTHHSRRDPRNARRVGPKCSGPSLHERIGSVKYSMACASLMEATTSWVGACCLQVQFLVSFSRDTKGRCGPTAPVGADGSRICCLVLTPVGVRTLSGPPVRRSSYQSGLTRGTPVTYRSGGPNRRACDSSRGRVSSRELNRREG